MPMPLPTRKKKAALSYIYTIGLMKNITKITAIITSTLLIGVIAGPANATSLKTETPNTVPSVERTYQPSVASASTPLNFESPVIKSVAAPIPEPEPEPVTQQTVRTASSSIVAVKPSTTPKTASTPQTPVTVAQAPVTASGKGAALLASARSQIGQIQDCTRMVERALQSIGIPTGDLAPNQFFRFGPTVSSPQPGDIIISSGHVGIYSGNGLMISGGFNGSQTVEHPISYVGAYSVVRVA